MAIYDSQTPLDPLPSEPAGKYHTRTRGRRLAMLIGGALVVFALLVFLLEVTGYTKFLASDVRFIA
jgi:hypothetical protein